MRDYWEDTERLGLPYGMTIDTYESNEGNAHLVYNNMLCNSVSVLYTQHHNTYMYIHIHIHAYIHVKL